MKKGREEEEEEERLRSIEQGGVRGRKCKRIKEMKKDQNTRRTKSHGIERMQKDIIR